MNFSFLEPPAGAGTLGACADGLAHALPDECAPG